MKIYIYIFLLMVISCQAQNDQNDFHYKSIPSQYDYLYKETPSKRTEVLKNLKTPFYVKSLLPKNYDKSGTVDYTSYFQKALLQNREVVFPSGKYFIGKQGLTIPSNTKVYFEDNCILYFEKNDFIRYEILRIHDVQNVDVYYANIVGDRNSHTGTEGEWGFGISIQDSKNISLYKPIVKDCWGDGIFIGSEGKIGSENVIVNGGLVDNNRRNGISVTSAKGLTISNVVAANSNGTFPKAGIDFEPSNNWEFMQNINVNNVFTFNNDEDGLLIVLVRLKAPESKKVNIIIENHVDQYSKYGLAMMLEDKKIIGKLPIGQIQIRNVNYSNNKVGDIRNYSPTEDNYVKILIDKISSTNTGKKPFTSAVVPNNITIQNSGKKNN